MPPPSVTLPLWYVVPPLAIVAGWLIIFVPLWVNQTLSDGRLTRSYRRADAERLRAAKTAVRPPLSPVGHSN